MAYAELLTNNTVDLKVNSLTVNSIGGGQPYLYRYLTNNESLTTATETALSGLTTIYNQGAFVLSSNQINVPVDGTYLVIIQGSWLDAGTVNATPFNRLLYLNKNSTGLVAVNSKIIGLAANANEQTPVSYMGIARLLTTDDLELYAIQDSGASATLLGGLGGNNSPYTSIQMIYLCP